jgi:hypothetical protein
MDTLCAEKTTTKGRANKRKDKHTRDKASTHDQVNTHRREGKREPLRFLSIQFLIHRVEGNARARS